MDADLLVGTSFIGCFGSFQTEPRLSKAINVSVAAAADSENVLTYSVNDDGRVIITTTYARSQSAMVTQYYDVRPIVLHVADCFDPKDTNPPVQWWDQEYAESVRSLILDTVDSNSWRENGGNAESLRFSDGYLEIDQLPENHIAIRQLLNQLIEVRGKHVESFFAR